MEEECGKRRLSDRSFNWYAWNPRNYSQCPKREQVEKRLMKEEKHHLREKDALSFSKQYGSPIIPKLYNMRAVAFLSDGTRRGDQLMKYSRFL